MERPPILVPEHFPTRRGPRRGGAPAKFFPEDFSKRRGPRAWRSARQFVSAFFQVLLLGGTSKTLGKKSALHRPLGGRALALWAQGQPYRALSYTTLYRALYNPYIGPYIGPYFGPYFPFVGCPILQCGLNLHRYTIAIT